MVFTSSDFTIRRYVEAWEASRTAIADGGLLKNIDNPIILAECRDKLTIMKGLVSKFGFQEDSFLLRKLYGGNETEGTPHSLKSLYEAIAIRIRLNKESPDDPSVLSSKELFGLFVDCEIERITRMQAAMKAQEEERIEYRFAAAVIPTRDQMETLLRYATHISREIDKTINRLERMQMMRTRQTTTPVIDVNRA